MAHFCSFKASFHLIIFPPRLLLPSADFYIFPISIAQEEIPQVHSAPGCAELSMSAHLLGCWRLWIGLCSILLCLKWGGRQLVAHEEIRACESSCVFDASESCHCSDLPSVTHVFCVVFPVTVMDLHCLLHLVTNSVRMQNPGARHAVCDCDWAFLCVKLREIWPRRLHVGAFISFQYKSARVIKSDGQVAWWARGWGLFLLLGILEMEALH